jgi:hypothetical protein
VQGEDGIGELEIKVKMLKREIKDAIEIDQSAPGSSQTQTLDLIPESPHLPRDRNGPFFLSLCSAFPWYLI